MNSVELSKEDRKRLAYSLSDSIDLLDNFLKNWVDKRKPRKSMIHERAELTELAERLCPEEFHEHRRKED